MASDLIPADYAEWLTDLKVRIHLAQQRATLSVNRELIGLYWQLGKDILSRQATQGWGAKVIDRLARDLRAAFPEMKGFSRANLLYVRAFAEAWPDPAIVQQVVGQLPWGHFTLPPRDIRIPAARMEGSPNSLLRPSAVTAASFGNLNRMASGRRQKASPCVG